MKQIIETHNITIFDEPETKEAFALLYQAKRKYIWTILGIALSILAFIIFLAILVSYNPQPYLQEDNFPYYTIPLMIISGISTLAFLIVRRKLLRPYRKLYGIARRNDRIRNDEQLRYKERKRLEALDTDTTKIKEKDIDQTLRRLDMTYNKKETKAEIKADKKFIPPKKPPIKENKWIKKLSMFFI